VNRIRELIARLDLAKGRVTENEIEDILSDASEDAKAKALIVNKLLENIREAN